MSPWQWITAITSLLAALFWFWSALIKIPDVMNTSLSGPNSITSIMQRQSRLSAIAAFFAALSAVTVAISMFDAIDVI